MTIVTDISEHVSSDTKEGFDRKMIHETSFSSDGEKKTQVYEPKPINPDDDVYDEIIEQFASSPTMPKYYFEEFGDYWSCSCGHINKGEVCKNCGLKRELLRSLFILHKPDGKASKFNKKLRKNKEQVDIEEQQHAEKESRRKLREESGEDMTKVIPIEVDTTNELTESDKKKEDTAKLDNNSESKGISNSQLAKTKLIIIIIICLALIGAGAYAIYMKLAAPAMKYEEAMKLQNNGQYEKAIAKYEALGDYKDSHDMIWQCYIQMADKYYDDGEFQKAIETYEIAEKMKSSDSISKKIRACYIGIGDDYLGNKDYDAALKYYGKAAEMASGEDVQKKIYDAKYAYFKAHKSERTEKVESYLNELFNANYPGISEPYNQYYAWNIKIIANDSETDYTTDLTTVSRKDTVYFHSMIDGGKPNETLSLYYEVTWPSGNTEVYDLQSSWSSGAKINARFQYPIPLFGKEGKITFKLYNKSTNELLGSDSITFKN